MLPWTGVPPRAWTSALLLIAGVGGLALVVSLAFGNTGVNIAMHVWHGVLTALGEVSDFLVVDRGGEGNNLEEHVFEVPYSVVMPAGGL